MKRGLYVVGILAVIALALIWWMTSSTPGDSSSLPEAQEPTDEEGAGRPGLLAGAGEAPPIPTRPLALGEPDAQPTALPTAPEPSVGEPKVTEPVTLRVRVVDDSDEPAEGVEILEKYLAPSRTWKTRSIGTSDVDGVAVVKVPDYTAILLVGKSERWHCNDVLTLKEGAGELVFRVSEMLLIEGRVLTIDGEPSPGSHVMAFYLERRNSGGGGLPGLTRHGPTDEDGRFTARIPAYVSKVQLMAFAKGGGKGEVSFDPKKQREVVLQPRLTPIIRGIVVSAAGEAVKSFAVDAHALDGGTVEGVSGGGGHEAFGVRVSAPGRYVLTVRPDAPGLACSEPMEVQAPIDGLRIVCPPGASLEGELAGEDAQGFRVFYVRHRGPDARLRVTREARAKVKGAFAFDGLKEGDALLYAFRDGDERYGLAETPSLGEEALKLTLRKGEQVKGRVVGYDGRRGYDLNIGLLWRGPPRWGTVQEDGTFQIGALPPGTYELMWWRGEHMRPLERKVQSGEVQLELRLPEVALSYGRVGPK